MLSAPINLISVIAGAVLIGRGYLPAPAKMLAYFGQGSQAEFASSARHNLDERDTLVTRLVSGALHQVGKVTDNDSSYRKIKFPYGDVPANICTGADFIVRAYRAAGVDLQERIFRDKSNCPAAYPKHNGTYTPDTNIDHREIPALEIFFSRRGVKLPVTHHAADYQPGDIIICIVGGKTDIAIVAPSPTGAGGPWIVHNLNWGARIEDKLFENTITGHYRYRAGM